MINIYITPILTYGLEALVLSEKDMKPIEIYYRSLLRQIQHLPTSTAIPAIYLLMGCIPIEGQIHVKMLTFFGRLVRNTDRMEFEIIPLALFLGWGAPRHGGRPPP
jgi:hypothetical protein